MEFIKVNAITRKTIGKGAARRMRKAELVPAVVYCRAKETVAISVNPSELVHALAGPLRVNTPLNMTIKDGAKTVMETLVVVRDHQYDPLTRELLHVDFLAVTESSTVNVVVPFHTKSRSVGEQMGGTLVKKYRELPLSCTQATIPAEITADVAALNINDSIVVKNLSLPAGVSVRLPENTSLISVVTTRIVAEEGPAATAAAPAAAAAAPATAAPAAKKK